MNPFLLHLGRDLKTLYVGIYSISTGHPVFYFENITDMDEDYILREHDA